MKVTALDHIQFIVRDLDESIAFFEKLGFKLENRTSHHGGSAELRIFPGGTVLEIHKYHGSEHPGEDHFAIATDDLEAAIKELRGKGIEIEDPALMEATGRYVSNFRDPSGFRWQLLGPASTRKKPDLTKTGRY